MAYVVCAGQQRLQARTGLTGRWKDIPVYTFSCLRGSFIIKLRLALP